MSVQFKGLHHVGVVVKDSENSTIWYEQNLGFIREREYNFPGGRVAHISRGSLRLELLQVDDALPMAVDRQEPMTYLRTSGVNHFAVLVDDLECVVAALAARGVEIAYPPTDGPEGSFVRVAFIRDNERTLIELCQAI